MSQTSATVRPHEREPALIETRAPGRRSAPASNAYSPAGVRATGGESGSAPDQRGPGRVVRPPRIGAFRAGPAPVEQEGMP